MNLCWVGLLVEIHKGVVVVDFHVVAASVGKRGTLKRGWDRVVQTQFGHFVGTFENGSAAEVGNPCGWAEARRRKLKGPWLEPTST